MYKLLLKSRTERFIIYLQVVSSHVCNKFPKIILFWNEVIIIFKIYYVGYSAQFVGRSSLLYRHMWQSAFSKNDYILHRLKYIWMLVL